MVLPVYSVSLIFIEVGAGFHEGDALQDIYSCVSSLLCSSFSTSCLRSLVLWAKASQCYETFQLHTCGGQPGAQQLTVVWICF